MDICGRMALFVFTMLLMTGCNGDVFVDDPQISAAELTIDGNGGEAVLTFNPDGLKAVGLTQPMTCRSVAYDVSGCLAGSSDNADTYREFTEPVRLVLFNDRAEVEIDGTQRGAMRFVVRESVYTSDLEFWVWLDYGAYTREVMVRVTPAARYKIESIDYGLEHMTVYGGLLREVESRTVTNSGSAPVTIGILPYQSAKRYVSFNSDERISSILDTEEQPMIEIPSFTDDKEPCMKGDKVRFCIGEQSVDAPVDCDFQVNCTVPAGETRRYVIYVEEFTVRGPYTIKAVNPVTGRRREFRGIVCVTDPVDYYISRE